jgi:tRNA(Ile)-lysidine synthase
VNKYILAISGGVDSSVLLDMYSKRPDLDLIIAHFDHGIREDSAKDAEFVENLAKKYNLPFETKREKLGKNASEDLARARRYKYLRELSKKYDAQIVTAQHADDAVETIAINLTRGTGWRGLAAMDSDITRPLIDMTKKEILDYAEKNKLKWREDSTNASDIYLRNRIRRNLEKINDDEKWQILGLWSEQKNLKKQIDKEVFQLIGGGPSYSRYFFTHIDEKSATECLRAATGALLTRPQLKKAIYAIKTKKTQKAYHAGSGVVLKFSSRIFTVELIK